MTPVRQAVLLTAAAAALLLVAHRFAPRRALVPADFTPGGAGALEFCDPTNPRFLPVVAQASPVTLTIKTARPAQAGALCAATLELRTATGIPIGPRDLTPLAGARLRLWAIDPALVDFHRLEARAGAAPGEWNFSFTPRFGRAYRFFADLEPAATGREFYASADLEVAPSEQGRPAFAELRRGEPDPPGRLETVTNYAVVMEDRRHAFSPAETGKFYARQPVEMAFPGASRLVAFDSSRTGLLSLTADSRGVFRMTFADPGRYSLWAWDEATGRPIASGVSIEVKP